jgi:methionyl aminopeptidase
MIERKSEADIAGMREAGRVVGRVLDLMARTAAPGVTLLELDEAASDVIAAAGADAAFRGYRPHFATTPFPGAICASVNEVIVHGIPDKRALREGDLLSIDCGAVLDGWVGDAAFSMVVGSADPDDLRLIEDTRAALHAGIEAARPGNRMGDIGAAIGAVGRGCRYGIPQGWGGHGIGRSMHEDPSVPNEGRPGRGLPLRAGMVLAIEPMFMAGGSDDSVVAEDGWSVVTVDGTRAAHEEHTVALTEDGPVVLTVP